MTRPTSRPARERRTIRQGVPVVFPRGYITGRGTQASLHIRPVKFISDESWSENVGPSTCVAGSWTGRSGERNRRILSGPTPRSWALGVTSELPTIGLSISSEESALILFAPPARPIGPAGGAPRGGRHVTTSRGQEMVSELRRGADRTGGARSCGPEAPSWTWIPARSDFGAETITQTCRNLTMYRGPR